MKQEEKQLLIKDLYARLPYGVQVQHTFSDGSIEIGELEFIVKEEAHLSWGAADIDDNFKPYFRPMSSMTEEEQQKYYNLTHQEDDDIWAKCLFDKMVDFCNEKHLDYRGLIEKGLALEAPEGMYKI